MGRTSDIASGMQRLTGLTEPAHRRSGEGRRHRAIPSVLPLAIAALRWAPDIEALIWLVLRDFAVFGATDTVVVGGFAYSDHA